MRKTAICLILLLILGVGYHPLLGNSVGPQISAQNGTNHIDTNELMAEVAKKASDNDIVKRQGLRFWKQITVRDLDKKGRIIERRGIKQGAGLDNEGLGLNPNELLSSSYIFTLKGHEEKNGRVCYIISFEPKPGLPDKGNGYKRVAIRFKGTLWIDVEKLYLVRMEAEMPRETEFSIWWPAGKIYKVNMEVTQSLRPNFDNIVVLDKVTVKIEYRKLFSHYSEEYIHEYTDYKQIQ